MMGIKIPTTADIEQWPWAVRAVLGCGVACLAELLTYATLPLHGFPAVFAFPAIIMSTWVFGRLGGVACTLAEAVLIWLTLAKTQMLFPREDLPAWLQLTIYLGITILLGWTTQYLAQKRTRLRTRELNLQLMLAQAKYELAEERTRISEQLRERDEMLRIAREVNGMGLWVWDPLKGEAQWSGEMDRMAGCTPGSISRMPAEWLPLIDPMDRTRIKQAWLETCDNGKNFHEQFRLTWPDGSLHWMESEGKCQLNSKGRIRRVVGVLTDITQRKLTEETMLRTEKLAVAGRLSAAMAHEINNPLEAVGNLLYLISISETSDTIRSYARQALDEVMRISMVTQQTLKFHRQAGTPTITRLSELVMVVLSLFRAKLRSTGITIQMRAIQEKGVMCMPNELQHIFANLVSNAIDAMPHGGRLVIRLRSSRDWRKGKTEGMRVTFADTGLGMNLATMRRVFEPFFTTKAETGTGLGLWVVSQLVERRHGDVRLWSTQRKGNSGTAFSVFLPLGNASSNSDFTPPMPQENSTFPGTVTPSSL
jgi:PAS domain S-box-containing protein